MGNANGKLSFRPRRRGRIDMDDDELEEMEEICESLPIWNYENFDDDDELEELEEICESLPIWNNYVAPPAPQENVETVDIENDVNYLERLWDPFSPRPPPPPPQETIRTHLTHHILSVYRWSFNTIEQHTTTLEATTTLTHLEIDLRWRSNHRRSVELLCRCLANLRHHNKNHPLRTLTIQFVKEDYLNAVDQLLVAAKQYGIHKLISEFSRLPIQSFVKFCRDNTHLQNLFIRNTTFYDDVSTSSMAPPQESSAITALDELGVYEVRFDNATAATKFSNLWMAHVTCPSLKLGNITVHGHRNDERRIARLRVVSELIKPSVEHLILGAGCPIENIEEIDACATFTEIYLDDKDPPIDFSPPIMQQVLQTIATRNRQLARFRGSPHDYPRDELLKLVRQFDHSPTGRNMLARSLPEIASFLKTDKSTDSATKTKTKGPKQEH